jgi:hypothetical protein
MSLPALDRLRQATAAQSKTGTYVSTAWVIVPIAVLGLAVLVLGLAIAEIVAVMVNSFQGVPDGGLPPPVAAEMGRILLETVLVISVGQLVLEATLGYLVYTLVRRRNEHFARQAHFAAGLLDMLRAFVSPPSPTVEGQLAAADHTRQQMASEERPKLALPWAVLVAVGIAPVGGTILSILYEFGVPAWVSYLGILGIVSAVATLYVFYMLGRDFRRHELREDLFYQDSERAAATLGLPFAFRRYERMPDRSFALYLVLTLITVGGFGIYWLYTLIADPNRHVRTQATYEHQLLDALSSHPLSP